MDITLNGKPHVLPAPRSVEALLKQLDLLEAHVAVAIDGAFVPRSTWAQNTIQPGASVEVVAPMQGG